MKSCCCVVLAVLVVGSFGVPSASADPNNPFALVNVIDLYGFFSSPVTLDTNDPNFVWFDPDAGPPPNYATYRADPRLGTNPASIAVDGDRLWITGFHNGHSFGASQIASMLAWYNSLGVGEVRNILFTSGFDGALIKFLDTVQFGPAIWNTDSFTGVDYDPSTQILYVGFDDVQDMFSLPPGCDPQQGSYIAAVDVDPNSPTYGEFLWKLTDPFHPPQSIFDGGDRFYGGVAVDPMDPRYVLIPQNGGPSNPESGFRIIDTLNPYGLDPNDPATRVNVKQSTAPCPATFYRTIAYDFFTGDLFVGNANAVEWIIDPGPNVVNQRCIGNKNMPDDTGDCNEDPINGYPNSPFAQGQGIAIVSAANLVDVAADLVVGNNRPNWGGGHLTDIRIFTRGGQLFGRLEIPCSPQPVAPSGLAYYDLDYDEANGTLVVCNMEQRLVYVFKTKTDTGPAWPRFDSTRNHQTDLADFQSFQACFTGGELPPSSPRLSLNCMRMNSDSDWDIDIDDYLEMEVVWDNLGGPQ